MKASVQQIKKWKGLCALSALAMASGLAQAAMVTQWSYVTDATLSNPTWTGGTGTTTNSPYEFSWGAANGNFETPTNPTNASNNRSALTVGDFSISPEDKTKGAAQATGTIMTDQDTVLVANEIGKGISLTHWNNPLNAAFSTLTGGLLTDTVTLTPLVPLGGGSQAGPTLSFNFKFQETPNGGDNGGKCADGQSAVNTWGYNANAATGGCPDLFGYTGLQVANQSFNYDGFNYFISVLTLNANGSLNQVGIGNLTNGECTAIGLGNGCFGFRTKEGQSTTQRFGLAVSATELPVSVPEPGSIALFGLALAGLAMVRRRKAS